MFDSPLPSSTAPSDQRNERIEALQKLAKQISLLLALFLTALGLEVFKVFALAMLIGALAFLAVVLVQTKLDHLRYGADTLFTMFSVLVGAFIAVLLACAFAILLPVLASCGFGALVGYFTYLFIEKVYTF